MNNKAKFSILACKETKIAKKDPDNVLTEAQEKKIAALNTTPLARKNINREEIDDERLSPYLIQFTQDAGDDESDVIWDWDSPRSKGNRNLHRKRILHSSPKIPKKQILNEKNLPMFNSLIAQFEIIANNVNDKEDTEDGSTKPSTPVNSTDNQDLFDDDSFDAEMIKCSQKVEEAYNLNKWCSSIINNNKEYKSSEKMPILFDTIAIKDDSFDVLLEDIKDEDIEKLSQASSSSYSSNITMFKKSNQGLSPRSISRTNSVPITKQKTISIITSSNLTSRTRSEDSGKLHKITCSPEEIEKKRQEARAKLEFKKKQQEIERKRLEALERLRRKRMNKISSQSQRTQQ